MRILLFVAVLLCSLQAQAFCGFYVAKADTALFNEASKVVIARHEDKTVITMASDYQGELSEFAMVVPVPTFLQRGQIHVTENAIVDHLDAYTAPRLVEYFDQDPCRRFKIMQRAMSMPDGAVMKDSTARTKSLGVSIEAEYTVGEYDILILSAKESDGLATWLNENGYQMPKGAAPILQSYIKQGTRFFVAKVNLEEQAKSGYRYLRPLQVAFESKKFMLPIRLGTLNARGDQELFVFTLTRKGRVEATNYRTVNIPSNENIPGFVKDEFAAFYQDMFANAVRQEKGRAVFLEYAWDMNWCDPCAADPLSRQELRELGVFWIPADKNPGQPSRKPAPGARPILPGGARDVYVTRLHLRYNRDTFPEDLIFQETGNRKNFQGRYVIRHAWQGESQCLAAEEYQRSLPERFAKEADTLTSLTGWNINDIRKKMAKNGQPASAVEPSKWWQQIWGN